MVVIEDVDIAHKGWLPYFLKIWSDHYPFYAERKGGTRCIRPEKIIVTSIYDMQDLSGDNPRDWLSLRRRFTEMTVNAEMELIPWVRPADYNP